MMGAVAHVAAGGGAVIGAVVVRVVLATVGCRGWCIACRWWSCSWSVGSPRPAVVVLVVSMFVEAVAMPGVPGLMRGGGGASECRWCHGRRCH